MNNNDLIDFMHNITREMGAEYTRIRKRSREDSGTAGDQGEENWATLFKNWLPADYQIVTKGRLLSEKGIASPQVDVIVLYPFYPKHLLDKKHYLTAGVAAAFECKNTLKARHIEKAVKNAVAIRNLVTEQSGMYRDEIYGPIAYGLLAHSHSWQGAKSQPLTVVEDKLLESDLKYVSHPRECLDFVCISDLAVWASFKLPMTRVNFEHDGKCYHDWIPGPCTGFGRSHKDMYPEGCDPYKSFTPIGSFLSKLFSKLALSDKRLDKLSRYFQLTVDGGFRIEKWRQWPASILSPGAQADVATNMQEYVREWMNKG